LRFPYQYLHYFYQKPKGKVIKHFISPQPLAVIAMGPSKNVTLSGVKGFVKTAKSFKNGLG